MQNGQNYSHNKSIKGIPGSGKSTIAKSLSSIIESQCFLESEEDQYPNDIKMKLRNSEKDENILDIHFYFRNMRAEFHRLAYLNKENKESSIIDSFFSKLMMDIICQPNTDYFINSQNKNFSRIMEISEKDSKQLADADIVIFLNVTKDVHNQFLKTRQRESEVDDRIFMAQNAFYNAAVNYSNQNNKLFFNVQQECNLNKIIDFIIEKLLIEDLIC